MSEIYNFIWIATYIGLVLWAIVKSEKKEGGAGLVIGMMIMGFVYSMAWPLLYVYCAWYYMTDQENKP